MEHPITPPDELRRLWAQQAQRIDPRDPVAWMQHVSAQAAQWGADQELAACCAEVSWFTADILRAARRPKPLSLKEQALEALNQADEGLNESAWQQRWDTIRRALEALPND